MDSTNTKKKTAFQTAYHVVEDKGWQEVHDVKYGRSYTKGGNIIVIPKNNGKIVAYIHEYTSNGKSITEIINEQANAILEKSYPKDRSIKPRGHVLRALTKDQRIIKLAFDHDNAFEYFISTMDEEVSRN